MAVFNAYDVSDGWQKHAENFTNLAMQGERFCLNVSVWFCVTCYGYLLWKCIRGVISDFSGGKQFSQRGKTQTWPGLFFLHVQASAARCVHTIYCHWKFVTECNANYYKLLEIRFWCLYYIFRTNSGEKMPLCPPNDIPALCISPTILHRTVRLNQLHSYSECVWTFSKSPSLTIAQCHLLMNIH